MDWDDFNCFTLRVSNISVTEKNIFFKHAIEKSNVRNISGKNKVSWNNYLSKQNIYTLCFCFLASKNETPFASGANYFECYFA